MNQLAESYGEAQETFARGLPIDEQRGNLFGVPLKNPKLTKNHEVPHSFQEISEVNLLLMVYLFMLPIDCLNPLIHSPFKGMP